MYWTERHVFVCTGNHCIQKGANQMLQRFRFELLRNRLNVRVHLNTCGTIDLCDIGPNVVVYPDNIVYSGVHDADIPDIIAFLKGGPVVERLVTDAASPEEENRRAFYQSLRDEGPFASPDRTAQLAEDRRLDQAWIDEQLRRGFMARKPDPEGGDDRMSMTSKAMHRYRLDAPRS